MPHLILDASVGIKTRVAEPLSDRAAAILASMDRGTTIAVPDLFFVECANVLWKYVRRLGYSAQKARADLVQLLDLPLVVTRTADLVLEAFDLARAHDITVYDASYLALAIEESATLITADEKLARKLASLGSTVRWLGEITDPDLVGPPAM
jgi:predicted nucleic acid-binding protein